ncbi:MAG TPA: HDOD domain-containing protein [candidate division Zixibacteria bacterium]|nr:HDOD domain-containing protein [candidate division Zixibacteria bacterium]
MTKTEIVEQIRRNDKLLSLPQVMSEVLEEIGKEDFSADKLGKIILKDPSLTGRILKLANSPFYCRLSEIKTVHQAVSILGVTTVKCLALSSSVLNPDRVAASSGVSPQSFFSYVLSVAAACESIAKAVDYRSTEEAFIAGLLHDVGVLFFLHHYPEAYAKVIHHETHSSSLAEAERMIFGIDHAEIGGYLAEVWSLPEYISKSIVDHHNGNRLGEDETLNQIVALAVLITGDRYSGYDIGIEDRLNQIKNLSSMLSIEKEVVDEISSSILSRTIDVANYLGVDIGNIEDMLVKANQEIWKSYLTIENLFKERQELSASLLNEERERGAIEAKNVAMATLSHYLNNATMAIYGRSQLMRMLLDKGRNEDLLKKLPNDLEVMNRSILKIVAVLEEMREISPIDKTEFYNLSKALNIDDRLKTRIDKMTADRSWETGVETAPSPV